jgi:hypothetical protein
MVWAGPVLFGLKVGRVLAQALSVVGRWAHVTAHQLTPVPAHLQTTQQRGYSSQR